MCYFRDRAPNQLQRLVSVAILSPGYPDTPGGVRDHTARLVRHWSGDREVRVLDGDSATPPDGLPSLDVDALLIQYVPFLYGRRGLSRLPERMAGAARRAGIRVTTFIHEPWVPPTRPPWWILSPLQRRQLRRLVDVSDAAVTPVPAWTGLFRTPVQVAYVGSTLDASAAERVTPAVAPVVFSPFAAGLRWDWIVAAVDRIGATPPAVVIGASLADARDHPATARFARPDWEWCGRLPAGEVMARLAGARLVLAPFVDGLTARRTSAMAAGNAGARVVSSAGPLCDRALLGGPFVVADDREGFAELAAKEWRGWNERQRAGHRTWYEQHLDGRRLDEHLLRIVTG